GRPRPRGGALQLGAGGDGHRGRLRRGPRRPRHDAQEGGDRMSAHDWIDEHRTELDSALSFLRDHAGTVEQWAAELAGRLAGGARLLAAGNGGSAAEAQHLTSELVGRFLHDRRSFSAISLCSESSSVSAIVNDYGAEEMFARQVEGHGRPGDVLVLLSTSGTSPNVLRAAERGRDLGLTVWGL